MAKPQFGPEVYSQSLVISCNSATPMVSEVERREMPCTWRHSSRLSAQESCMSTRRDLVLGLRLKLYEAATPYREPAVALTPEPSP